MNDLEQQLAAAAGSPQRLAGPWHDDNLASRADNNLRAIHIELDTPAEPRLARWLRRIGVDDLTIPLVTATPALRRSWFVAIAIAVLFALSATTNTNTAGVDRISVFLTIAPLVPLLGVALAFGRGVDPTHDLVVAAPRDTFAVFLIRSATVLNASSLLLLMSSVLLPDGGLYRVAWLLPGLAVTLAAMALSARWQTQRVAAALGISWIVLVIVTSSAASVAAMFGPVTQVLSLVAMAIAGWTLARQRHQFDEAGGHV